MLNFGQVHVGFNYRITLSVCFHRLNSFAVINFTVNIHLFNADEYLAILIPGINLLRSFTTGCQTHNE